MSQSNNADFSKIDLEEMSKRGVVAPMLSKPKSSILSGRPLTIGESVGVMLFTAAAVVVSVVWWLFFRK